MRTNEILMICCLIFLIISLLASSINKFPEIVKNGSIFIAVILLAVSQILPNTKSFFKSERTKGHPALPPGVVISLTTIPNRIDRVEPTIKSLLSQDFKPTNICLFIDNNMSIPEGLQKLSRNNPIFIIDRVRHIGPATKFVYTQDKFPGAMVAVCDDDQIYPPGWLSHMLDVSREFGYKKAVGFTGFVKKEELGSKKDLSLEDWHDKDGIMGYKSWNKGNNRSRILWPQGYTGYLLPAGVFDHSLLNVNNYCLKLLGNRAPKLSGFPPGLPYVPDDPVVGAYCDINGIKLIQAVTSSRTSPNETKNSNITSIEQSEDKTTSKHGESATASLYKLLLQKGFFKSERTKGHPALPPGVQNLQIIKTNNKQINNEWNIAILTDKYSGHLFHDLELYIVAFSRLYKENTDNYETTCNIHMIMRETPVKFTKNHLLNEYLSIKIFGCEMTKKEYTDFDKKCYDIVVDRHDLDHKNINKAFAECILCFPFEYWSTKFELPICENPNKFKMLYAARQNTPRRLHPDSHNFIVDLVKKYDGTIIDDLGVYSIEDQIKIFRTHHCVIGVHGNNLSGVLWMKPKSHVFEIIPSHADVYDYQCLALCMNHQYTHIKGIGKLHNTKMIIEEPERIGLKRAIKIVK